MGTHDRRQRHRDELRARILAAAEELFVRDGFANVSMRRIASRIEYSPTTLYRYFENKAEIMSCLMEDGYRGVAENYQSVLAGSLGSPFEALMEIVRVYVEFALAHPNHYELWFATGQLEIVGDHLEMSHGPLTFKVYQTWLDLIDACRQDGLFLGRSSRTAFQIMWATVHGLISLRLRHTTLPWPPVAEHVEALRTMIDRGLAHSAPEGA